MKTQYIFSTLIVLCCSAFVYSQAGSIDPEFGGGNGFVTTSIYDDQHSAGNAITIQEDGKILVSGYTGVPGNNAQGLLIRYLPDGSFDNSFNGSGMVFFSDPSMHCYVIASVEQPDGKIVALVRMNINSEEAVALHRFYPDGTPDPGFDSDGVVTIDLGTNYQGARALALQADGKLVMAGYVGMQGDTFDQFFVARFLPDGMPDNSFDGDGMVITSVGDAYTNVGELLIQPDGKIIIAGYAMSDGYEDFAVLRYLPNGALDPSFSGDGIATASACNYDDGALGAVLQPDGKIVLGGYAENPNGNKEFAVARFTSQGILDNTFHGDGLNIVPVTTFADGARDILLQPDGKIILGGYAHSNIQGGADMALVRLTAGGIPDFTFDGDGVAIYPSICPSSDFIYYLAWQPDGKFVASGLARENDRNVIAVARFLSGITVSTSEIYTPEEAGISLFPNPVSEQINIEYELDNTETIAMYMCDMQGRIVQELLPSVERSSGKHSEKLTLNHNVSPGTYIVNMQSQEWMTSVTIVIE